MRFNRAERVVHVQESLIYSTTRLSNLRLSEHHSALPRDTTDIAASSAIRFRPITPPMYLLRFSLLSSRSSRPLSRTSSTCPGPFSLVNVSCSSHSTHGQSELRAMTSPFTGTEAPFHVAFSRIPSFFRLAYLCSVN